VFETPGAASAATRSIMIAIVANRVKRARKTELDLL
jgi:hypothetical protein